LDFKDNVLRVLVKGTPDTRFSTSPTPSRTLINELNLFEYGFKFVEKID
jgi:hypothetical protein